MEFSYEEHISRQKSIGVDLSLAVFELARPFILVRSLIGTSTLAAQWTPSFVDAITVPMNLTELELTSGINAGPDIPEMSKFAAICLIMS